MDQETNTITAIDTLVQGKNAFEIPDIKATQVLKYSIVGTKVLDDTTVNILSIEKIPSGVVVYVQANKSGQKIGFGDGTVEIEKFTIINPPTCVDDPMGNIQIPYTDFNGKPQVRLLREDPVQALNETLYTAIRKTASVSDTVIPGKVGKSTLIVFPSSDLACEADGASWALAHAKVTADLTYTTHGYVMGRGDSGGVIVRYYINFDTSALTSGATISAVNLGMWGQDKAANGTVARSYNVYQSTAADTITSADMDSCNVLSSDTKFCATDITEANFKTDSSTEMDFAFNATGIAAISKTGITKIVHREVQYDAGNVDPASSVGFPYGDYLTSTATGTSHDPTLTVTYTTGGAIVLPRKALTGVGQ